MNPHDPRSTNSTAGVDAAAGGLALLRFGWMAGDKRTMLIALTILVAAAWTIGMRHALPWLGVLASLTLRHFVRPRRGGPTSEAEPASRVGFQRHA